MKIIGRYHCHFAAKSGGHAMFAGASSAADGISIDLRYLNQLELSDEKNTLFVGPGNRWGEVYTYLDAFNLTAIGGRVGDVGVGGFLLGGTVMLVYHIEEIMLTITIRWYLVFITQVGMGRR